MERDRDLERRLLDRVGGPPEFTATVLARLDAYEANHGNTGWDRPVSAILAEIEEEAADIPGWSLGAAGRMSEQHLHRLVVVMSLGAAAWREARALRELLEE